MPHPGGGAGDQHVLLVGLAEPVVSHRRRPVGAAGVDVLAVQQLQRHPDTGKLTMHPVPVRLRVNTVVLATSRKQPRIHVGFVEIGDLVPADPFPIRP